MTKKLLIAAVSAAALAAIYGFTGVESGLKVGEMVTPFNPTHISGPDKGTNICPPCNYGARPAVQAWVSPSEKPEIVASIGKVLEGSEAKFAKAEFQGFMIMLTRCEDCVAKANTFAKDSKTSKIGIATLDVSNEAVKAYKVNTGKEVLNTIFVYKDKKVVEKFVNLTNSKEDTAKLEAAIAKASS